MIKNLHDYKDDAMSRPRLAEILCELLTSWLDNRPAEFHDLTPELIDLVQKQGRLGLRNLFLGRFVKEWRTLQDQHLATLEEVPKKFSGKTWVTGAIKIIWDQVIDCWEERNNKKHGIDRITAERALAEQAEREIRLLYSQRRHILPRDNDLIYETAEEHLEQEPTARGRRQWLLTWKPVIKQGIEFAKKHGLVTRRFRTTDIRDYMST